MIKFRYQRFRSSRGEVLRPIAEVILEANRRRIEVAMCIDSGADMTMIPLHLGKAMGFRQSSADEIMELTGVSGGGVPYVVRNASVIMNGVKTRIRLAWALIEEVPLLLGRLDIFPKFKIMFDEKAEVVTFRPH